MVKSLAPPSMEFFDSKSSVVSFPTNPRHDLCVPSSSRTKHHYHHNLARVAGK
ncbi:hypothetical protein Syun_014046 [Stephania yunnanensis]|uniref:Uncharacterized protein n=1 Tax=Stephania yunnanensis TaxID=152371 RepID=A0AAP0JJN6_9MAGN